MSWEHDKHLGEQPFTTTPGFTLGAMQECDMSLFALGLFRPLTTEGTPARVNAELCPHTQQVTHPNH